MKGKHMDKRIQALLAERLGYERRGKTDRVAAVDEQLRVLGYNKQPEAPIETAAVVPQVERSAKRKSKKREI